MKGKNKNRKNQKPIKLVWLEKFLKSAAVLTLKKYQPQIIGLTGSVGKTSAKEALARVLEKDFLIRKNEKNYNNEIGVPLTIIGVPSGERSFGKWLSVFFRWLRIMIFTVPYPKILILEMGADRPGDIRYLTRFVKCQFGIITAIAESHIEFFGSQEKIAEEKFELVKSLEEKGLAILNADSPQLFEREKDLRGRKLTFGFSERADLRATDVDFNYSEQGNIQGLSFKLNFQGTTLPVRLNQVLARHQIYSALIATAVGRELGLNLVKISSLLLDFAPPPGRLKLLPGIKKTLIIDDTYNASPASVLAALEVLEKIRAPRKIVVLGDMLELGEETEKNHRRVGRKLFEIKADWVFLLGKRMEFAREELRKHGWGEDKVLNFENHLELGRKLQALIREGDLILIKGSQSLRMEKFVEEIMAEPQRAEELLCRQNPEWKKKSYLQV